MINKDINDDECDEEVVFIPIENWETTSTG